MGPAVELPPLPRSLLNHVDDARLQQELLPQYEDLVERMRLSRPERGSAEELELVRESIGLSLRVLEHLGHRALAYLRSDVQGQLEALIRDELSSADTTRKLALRHLQKSVEVVGTLVELVGDLYRGLPDAAVADLVRVTADGDEPVDDALDVLDDDRRGLLAWWLSLSVALECTVGDLDDLTYWARRVIEGSRRVEAWLPRLTSEVRALNVRLRARWAWADWDEHEIEHEIEAWRDLAK